MTGKTKGIGNWFRGNRKAVSIHGTIIVIFILFLLFASGPLFEITQNSEGVASLQKITLPFETNNIVAGFDIISVLDTTIEIGGWAFTEGQGTENSRIYIVLKSDKNTYVFDTISRKRGDITTAFSTLNLNLNNSGFITLIPRDKIVEDRYNIGIYIKKGDSAALEYTDKIIIEPR
jgi:hypothetical protein